MKLIAETPLRKIYRLKNGKLKVVLKNLLRKWEIKNKL